jgi:protocatechuate 3,4-dioxygenase beta subunit
MDDAKGPSTGPSRARSWRSRRPVLGRSGSPPGVVSFRSIFPGWYNGRDVHVHVLAIHPGSESRGRETCRDGGHILTTQFYFEPDLIDRVHKASQPYLRRTVLPAYADAIRGDESNNSGLRAKASFDGKIVVAQMQIALDPTASVV